MPIIPAGNSLQSPRADKVYGNLIQFNNNGAGCWYQDERVIINGANNLLIVGSKANAAGVGGSPRSADIEAVTFDLETRTGNRFLL